METPRSRSSLLIFFLLPLVGCAAGPRDTLGGGGPVVRAEAGAPAGYSYVARRPLVAVGLAGVTGLSEEDAHAIVDRLAASASDCLEKRTNVTPGAAHIELPIDSGGLAGPPSVAFSPTDAAAIGLVCILAPLRMTVLSPIEGDAGARSIAIESAWGPQ